MVLGEAVSCLKTGYRMCEGRKEGGRKGGREGRKEGGRDGGKERRKEGRERKGKERKLSRENKESE